MVVYELAPLPNAHFESFAIGAMLRVTPLMARRIFLQSEGGTLQRSVPV
jgi:hypothetical protein